jgi:hypothetical protein
MGQCKRWAARVAGRVFTPTPKATPRNGATAQRLGNGTVALHMPSRGAAQLTVELGPRGTGRGSGTASPGSCGRGARWWQSRAGGRWVRSLRQLGRCAAGRIDWTRVPTCRDSRPAEGASQPLAVKDRVTSGSVRRHADVVRTAGAERGRCRVADVQALPRRQHHLPGRRDGGRDAAPGALRAAEGRRRDRRPGLARTGPGAGGN